MGPHFGGHYGDHGGGHPPPPYMGNGPPMPPFGPQPPPHYGMHPGGYNHPPPSYMHHGGPPGGYGGGMPPRPIHDFDQMNDEVPYYDDYDMDGGARPDYGSFYIDSDGGPCEGRTTGKCSLSSWGSCMHGECVALPVMCRITCR